MPPAPQLAPAPPAPPLPPLPINPADPPVPPVSPAVVWENPLPPLPYNNPPAPPLGLAAVPSAPLPISGRPNSAWVGALIKPSTCCSTLVASALAYAPALDVRASVNWS
ncbi:PE-PGRS family protein PE_PGRS20 [Mycobacterium tuberculosis]|nr:PE-PGRS family protein PE_PGRS20 [Mycobacterium tuberculosis]